MTEEATGTKMAVEIAIKRERARMEFLLEEANTLLERRRDVLAEIRRIEQLLGIRAERKWRNGKEDPTWALAYAALSNAGRPMHIREITRYIDQKRSHLREARVKVRTLKQALSAKRATFVLLYTNTWGLREWAAANETPSTSSAEIPNTKPA